MSTVQKFTGVGNTRAKFRDSFANPAVAQPNPDTWALSNPGGHLISQGGDSSGASYLRISLNPFADDSEVSITSKQTFNTPTRIGFGVSLSQRILGQEIFAGLLGCNEFEQIDYMAAPVPVQIPGTASVTSNVATFTLTGHGFKGGDRVTLYGHTTPQLNVDPVVVTVVDANTFTVPATIANGTYAAGGYIILQDPLGGARNGVGLLWENTTATNASFVARRNGAKFRTANSTVSSSAAVQTNTNPHTDSFNATANNELYFALDEVAFRSFSADGGGGVTGYGKYSQSVPDEDNEYKFQFRARILKGATRPIARVATIAKSGTTTATVVTDAPHGLAVTDWVQVYGVRDQTNFAAQTSAAQVASIVDATTFTVVLGSAVTANSVDGAVYIVEGGVAAPGAITQAVQSISRTNGVLTLTGSGTWAGLLPGEMAHVHGLTGAASAYEGAYKVLRLSTTTLELSAPGPDFGSITTGGLVIKRTDVRLHWARAIDYTRLAVEVLGGKGQTNDANNAVPVTVAASATLPVTAGQGSGVSTTAWSAAGWGGMMVADVASAAITSTTTTTAVSPGVNANIGTYAHSFNVVVTAVSGTTPTMDVGVEESIDNGTNWVRVYDFPRITANGSYTSPLMRATYGTRYRYVQTITGTTPSFTRAVNRIQFSSNAPLIRQFVDRSVTLTTLNSTTPTYNVDGATKLMLVVNVGAITTTAPALQVEGTEDGSTWYAIGAPLTAVASSTVMLNLNELAIPRAVRARVSTAGVGVTAGYVSIKALGA